ncbi:hypothetical protein A9Q83_16970 [Alphaproteobacteria bacterium 46_93_T64]|nr:hypothetical protein A9Q83_16970 [Alphaproteobacteria bacterium 46_93_T64]
MERGKKSEKRVSPHVSGPQSNTNLKDTGDSNLHIILDSAPVAISLKDREGHYLHVNKTYANWFNTVPSKLVGKTIHDIEHRSIASKISTYDQKVFEEGQEVIEETQMQSSSGLRTIILHKIPVFAEDGSVAAVSTVGTDISGRKLVESALYFIAQRGWEQNESEFFHSLTKYLSELFGLDYVFVGSLLDDGKTIETMSMFAMGEYPGDMQYALKDTPCENVVGQNMCFYPDNIQAQFSKDELLVEMKAESYVGIPLWSSQKKPLGLIVAIDQKPIKSPHLIQSVLQVVAVRAAHELEQLKLNAERKTLEEQLRRTQKMEAVGHLSGGIAHDFNNILGVILGNLELLQDMLENDELALERIEKAMSGAERGAEITKKLLSFTRNESMKIEVIDLNKAIIELESLITHSLTETVKIIIRLSSNLWPVAVDKGDFGDTLLNLSINARDAMPDGGEFMIKTSNQSIDRGYFVRKVTGDFTDYVVISISDTGSGMSEEVRNRIFEPFFTTKEAEKGTGLGLSMVYGFVQRSLGHINVVSDINAGSTFSIYLPRAIGMLEEEDLTI